MKLIDTHCHLDEQAFENDLPEVLTRAADVGLQAIVSLGTTLDSSRKTVALADTNPLVYAAVGIHPNYASQAHHEDWGHIETLATSHPKIVAIGETGLDRYWDYAPIETQIDYFHRHIRLSRTTGKPFVIHCREAEEDVLRELRTALTEGPVNAVMHSFCGSAETLDAVLEMGLMISFAGMFTFKRNTELRSLAGRIPHDRLMVETDAPYLAPEPKRGKRNEPALVEHTANRLAQELDLTPHELGELTTKNAKRFFGLEGEN